MNLVIQLKFFHVLTLSKIDREKVFADVLDITRKWKFFKGVSKWFSSPIKNFFNFDFYAN